MTLPAEEFIRRFLIHTLPPGFQRIRHFGFLANCHRRPKLSLCRQLLTHPIAELLPAPAQTRELTTSPPTAPAACPHCGAGMVRVTLFAACRWPAQVYDTS